MSVAASALVGMGSDAGQSRGLTPVEVAEFGHAGDQGGGGFGFDAANGAQDALGLGQILEGGDGGLDGGIECLDLRVEAGAQVLRQA